MLFTGSKIVWEEDTEGMLTSFFDCALLEARKVVLSNGKVLKGCLDLKLMYSGVWRAGTIFREILS